MSSRTICEYAIYLEHLFSGLSGESIPSAIICPHDARVGSLLNPAVEQIKHPAYKIPLIGRANYQILLQRLEKFKPTILHCLSLRHAGLTKKLARELNLPYVISVNTLQKRFPLIPVSSKHLANIIVPAKTIAENFSRIHPRLADRIKQINIGTFTEDFTNCFKTPGRLSTIVIACNLDDIAPLETLLNAIRHLAIDGYEFMLVIIGDGRGEMKLRKILIELGLTQIVTMVPRVQPWRSVFAIADIFIQPQPCNSFDPLLLEAMSVGAAVAAAKGGVDDLVIESETAAVFDPADELSIYSTIQLLFDRHETAKKLAVQAQQYLKEHYSVTAMIEDMIKTYRQAQDRVKT